MNDLTPWQHAARRKRLGQFFSGNRLGRLLAGLTHVQEARSVIDPMAGRGDLLSACLELGAAPTSLVGVEIDEAAADQARRRLPSAELLTGDAFAPGTLSRLPRLGYDLVIGNPPFVRYQDGATGDRMLPSADEVRTNLRAAVPLFRHHDHATRRMVAEIVDAYSGLADLALPACLLSMLLVAPAGDLALVLPQSWLSRDYAKPIRFILESLFDVVALIEDENASWFPDALVRTMLVVAHRSDPTLSTVRRVSGAVHVRLKAAAADERSLAGRICPATAAPDLAFGRLVRRADVDAISAEAGAFASATVLTGLAHLRPSASKALNETAALPIGILQRVPSLTTSLRALPELGIDVGQGLRTGANEFFYVEASSGLTECRTSALFAGRELAGMDGLLRSVIRDQSESAGDLADGPATAILDLRRVALLEDLCGSDEVTRHAMRPMQEALAAHVRAASHISSGKPGRERPIPSLSAVWTNVRPPSRGRPARFWYQIPDFQPRHLPDVYLARINTGRPVARLNPGRRFLVDANFLTFRCPDSIPPEALASLLNSTWAWAQLEAMGAVMGGGALKLEATMLRRLMMADLDQDQVKALAAADAAEADAILINDPSGAELLALKKFCADRLKARQPTSRRNGKRL